MLPTVDLRKQQEHAGSSARPGRSSRGDDPRETLAAQARRLEHAMEAQDEAEGAVVDASTGQGIAGSDTQAQAENGSQYKQSSSQSWGFSKEELSKQPQFRQIVVSGEAAAAVGSSVQGISIEVEDEDSSEDDGGATGQPEAGPEDGGSDDDGSDEDERRERQRVTAVQGERRDARHSESNAKASTIAQGGGGRSASESKHGQGGGGGTFTGEDGTLLEAFNLDEEREMGHYDGSGAFVWGKEGRREASRAQATARRGGRGDRDDDGGKQASDGFEGDDEDDDEDEADEAVAEAEALGFRGMRGKRGGEGADGLDAEDMWMQEAERQQRLAGKAKQKQTQRKNGQDEEGSGEARVGRKRGRAEMGEGGGGVGIGAMAGSGSGSGLGSGSGSGGRQVVDVLRDPVGALRVLAGTLAQAARLEQALRYRSGVGVGVLDTPETPAESAARKRKQRRAAAKGLSGISNDGPTVAGALRFLVEGAKSRRQVGVGAPRGGSGMAQKQPRSDASNTNTPSSRVDENGSDSNSRNHQDMLQLRDACQRQFELMTEVSSALVEAEDLPGIGSGGGAVFKWRRSDALRAADEAEAALVAASAAGAVGNENGAGTGALHAGAGVAVCEVSLDDPDAVLWEYTPDVPPQPQDPAMGRSDALSGRVKLSEGAGDSSTWVPEQVFGPFSSTQLLQWHRAGYLAGMWMRRVRSPEWERRKSMAHPGQNMQTSGMETAAHGEGGDMMDDLAADLLDDTGAAPGNSRSADDMTSSHEALLHAASSLLPNDRRGGAWVQSDDVNFRKWASSE